MPWYAPEHGGLREARHRVVATELEAAMRDGTVLRADVYRPHGAGPWPVLLARTPYGKRDPGVLARLDPALATRRGYLVVIQDCRGRFRSQGTWRPLAHEAEDGYDTVGWAAGLPGSDGRVCTYGPSYLAHAQWAAVCARPPALRAAAPEFTWSDPEDGLISRGGARELGLLTQWTLSLGENVLTRRHAHDPEQLRRRLGALEAARDALDTRTYWELPPGECLRRFDLPTPAAVGTLGTLGTLPQRIRAAHRPRRTIATLTVAGWYDAFLQGSLDNHLAARDSGAPAALIVGPWTHENQSGTLGELDYGSAADGANIDLGGSLLERQLEFFDDELRRPRLPPRPPAAPQTPHEPDEAPVLLFVMGDNRWRRFPSWPPESIGVPWYLHDGGRLSVQAPAAESPPDVYGHDPHRPVPTRGGALLMTAGFPAGPFDQRPIEARDDVLVYTSAALDGALEVIGRVRVHLIADSTAGGTDWVARLCDVDTEGVSRNITDGVVRTGGAPATGDATGESEGKPREIEVDLWSTAHVFLPGHRIRLQIASSCFPRWDRNFGAPGTRRARQRVHHDAAAPSRLVLPVLGRNPA